MYQLKTAFSGTRIIIVPLQLSDKDTSACGINLNTVLTNNALYAPVFGGVFSDNEERVLKTIIAHSDREVVPVEANGVCDQGGSVRCLT